MAASSPAQIGSPNLHALSEFHPPVRDWFANTFAAPTKAQLQAWPPIVAGHSTLLLAPTGSGKTLAAFLAALDRLMFADPQQPPRTGVRVLYISPLKALGVDIDRNLRGPLAGLRAAAQRRDHPHRLPRIAIRSGDTPADERQRIARDPPEILITTPESLYLMLTSQAARILTGVETVIVDEIHVMAPTKRGAHLFVSLERLERLRRQTDPDTSGLQRIGLSATQRPLEEIARLLGGHEATSDPAALPEPRRVEIVDASEPKRFELRVEVPVEDMAHLGQPSVPEAARPGMTPDLAASPVARPTPESSATQFSEAESSDASLAAGPASIWPAIHPRLLELIRQHRSTLAFVNSRRLAERLAGAINELAGEELAMAHHGSVAKDQRREIEDRLKRGDLPALFATSSLELGIDMGAIDLVIQIEAPPTIASGIQRIGRSGRGVNLISSGVLFPKYRADLLACAAAAGEMRAGRVESTRYPRNPLDLLAQQIVAIVSRESITQEDLYALIRSAAPYADLPQQSFLGVLDMLSGRYPSDRFAELRPRIVWDRVARTISPRKGAQRLAVLNGGTIPDRGLYGVFLTGDGPDGSGGSRVGELDEEMVFETHAGDVFLLGASSWRVLEITKDRVLVAPAPGEPGKMPFWRGEGPGRPLEFGRAVGRLGRELVASPWDEAWSRLHREHGLDDRAATNLLRYLHDQQDATHTLPSDQHLVVESFLDEIGDWRVCVLSPLGSRVHAPWALAIGARLRAEGQDEVDINWTDEGMIFRLPESESPPPLEWFLPSPDDVEEIVAQQLGGTSQFAARFRENAARALLLPKRQPTRRTPLWLQRRKAADLLAVAADFPSFPIMLETYRECLADVFDLAGLRTTLTLIQQHRIGVSAVETRAASPFAASLLFNYAGSFIYETDAPLAERRAQALTLDHAQLQQLLGTTELRSLLDTEVIDEIAASRQWLAPPRVRHVDDLHDLLLTLGDLTRDEIAARCDPQQGSAAPALWIDQLVAERRALEVRVAGEERIAAAEDAARLRDALGVNLPPGLPAALLEPAQEPLAQLLSRFARTHGPFTAQEPTDRFGLGVATVTSELRRLAAKGRLVTGTFLPEGTGIEWCDAEVLRAIKRRALSKLRSEVEAVDAQRLIGFLPRWQALDRPGRGLDALLDAIEQLQGAPLPASDLEAAILPARVQGYDPAMLDELLVAGEVVWLGVEAVGAFDGRIALYLTDQLPLLATPIDPLAMPTGEDDPLAQSLVATLRDGGAMRFSDLLLAVGGFPPEVLQALWRLVWAGWVTNDSMAPLRSLNRSGGRDAPVASHHRSHHRSRRRRAANPRGFRSRRAIGPLGSEGRWSLGPTRGEADPTATARQAAVVGQLLARHGILTRGSIARETTAGGFSQIYPVLKVMEESGAIRRGYFVEGLGGLQFAASGADDLLRAAVAATADTRPLILAATDPANPFGAALPWPEAQGSSRPQRTAGARCVLSTERLLGYLTASARELITFSSRHDLQADDRRALATALAEQADHLGGILLAKIDGRSIEGAVEGSPVVAALLQAGFRTSRQGLTKPRTR